jgi:hypothetical protein
LVDLTPFPKHQLPKLYFCTVTGCPQIEGKQGPEEVVPIKLGVSIPSGLDWSSDVNPCHARTGEAVIVIVFRPMWQANRA